MRGYRTQEVLFDSAGVLSTQYLYLDCEDGRPSAVTDVQVWSVDSDDTSSEESATTGSASVESTPNTTLSAAAGPAQSDPRALTLTSGSGVTIGRWYQITDDNSGFIEVGDVAKANGTSVTLRHPLKNDFTSGATFQSCRSSIALSTTWIAEQSNISRLDTPNPGYRVKWTVTVNGNPAYYVRYFDLVRYPFSHNVVPPDVDAFRPGWLDRLPPDYQVDQGRWLIEEAAAVVRDKLYQHNKADQAIRNAELLARLVIRRTVYESALRDAAMGADNERAVAVAKEAWDELFNGVINSPVAPVDEGGGGASQPNRRTPVWRR